MNGVATQALTQTAGVMWIVRAETFSWSLTNMSTLDLGGRLRVPSLTLGGSDLYTTLTNKHNSLTINGSNTEATGYKLASGTDNNYQGNQARHQHDHHRNS